MSQSVTRSLVAIYGTMFAAGLAFGLVLPAISIRLDSVGHDPGTIGAVAAMASLAVLVMAGKVPSLHARFGMIPIIIVSLVAQCILYLIFPHIDHLAWWFILTFVFGLVNTVPWVMGEVWLNAVVPSGKRGLFMAIYAGIWGAGMASGPQIMLAVGSEGNGPFYAAAVVYGLCSLWVLLLRKTAPEVEPDQHTGTLRGTFAMIWLMPILVLYAIAGGLAETIIYAMMPIYALGRGYGDAFGAHLISAFAAGGIILQFGVGYLSDYIRPRFVMTGLLGLGALTALALPLAGDTLWLAFAICFLFGGMAMSVYTLAITLVGHGIAKQHLSTAHALMVMCYTFGGLIGPGLAGLAIDWFEPAAMMWFVALIFGPRVFRRAGLLQTPAGRPGIARGGGVRAMEAFDDNGIVLSARAYGDSSAVVNILCEHQGASCRYAPRCYLKPPAWGG